MALFQHIIGNPPYQREVTRPGNTTKKSFQPIFSNFQKTAAYLCHSSTMIYPSSWQNSSASAFAHWMFDSGVVSGVSFPGDEVFGDAIQKSYPVTVVQFQLGYDGDIEADGVRFSREYHRWLNSTSRSILVAHSADMPKMLWDVKYITSLTNVAESGIDGFQHTPDSLHDPLCVTIKEETGLSGKSIPMFVERELVEPYFSQEDIDTYTVAIKQQYLAQARVWNLAAQNPRVGVQPQIFPPKHLFSKTWLKIASFDTQEEAEAFVKYITSLPISILLLLDRNRSRFGSAVPAPTPDLLKSIQDASDEEVEEMCYDFLNISHKDREIIQQEYPASNS